MSTEETKETVIEPESTNTATFATYGRSFQEKTMQAFLSDPHWSEQMMEVFKIEYFDLKYLQFLSERYFDHAKKYKVFPTLQLLVTIIRDELKKGSDVALRDQIIDYLQRMKSNPAPGDLQYVKDKSLDFCRKQALKEAFEQAIDMMEEAKYEQIAETIKKAVVVGTTPSMGHDFAADVEARFVKINRMAVPTGLFELDKKEILNGGLGKGELGCVIGSTGAGKCVFSNTFIYLRNDDGTDRRVTIGKLFDELQFPSSVDATDESGDSVRVCHEDLYVKSHDGYRKIQAVRWTKPEPCVCLTHRYGGRGIVLEDCIPSLDCSPDHLVWAYPMLECENSNEPTGGRWSRVRDLLPGMKIKGAYGPRTVCDVTPWGEPERLCDLQVDGDHSYFTNGLLSHNSHFLTMLGANALTSGRNVLHYTFELSETQIGIRYDPYLCEVDSNEVQDNKEFIMKTYSERNDLGRLIIKHYPMNTATIYTLKSHIERCVVRGFKPDLLVVDYADVMRSSRQFDSLRHELKLVYEELRGYADELGVPLWTASQSNKEGANSDIIDLTNMSEAYGKAMVADVVVSISRKSSEKATGFGRLYVAKNRAGRDGLVYPMKMNTARSKFEIVAGANTLEEISEIDELSVKRAIKEKLKQIDSRDSGIPSKRLDKEEEE